MPFVQKYARLFRELMHKNPEGVRGILSMETEVASKSVLKHAFVQVIEVLLDGNDDVNGYVRAKTIFVGEAIRRHSDISSSMWKDADESKLFVLGTKGTKTQMSQSYIAVMDMVIPQNYAGNQSGCSLGGGVCLMQGCKLLQCIAQANSVCDFGFAKDTGEEKERGAEGNSDTPTPTAHTKTVNRDAQGTGENGKEGGGKKKKTASRIEKEDVRNTQQQSNARHENKVLERTEANAGSDDSHEHEATLRVTRAHKRGIGVEEAEDDAVSKLGSTHASSVQVTTCVACPPKCQKKRHTCGNFGSSKLNADQMPATDFSNVGGASSIGDSGNANFICRTFPECGEHSAMDSIGSFSPENTLLASTCIIASIADHTTTPNPDSTAATSSPLRMLYTSSPFISTDAEYTAATVSTTAAAATTASTFSCSNSDTAPTTSVSDPGASNVTRAVHEKRVAAASGPLLVAGALDANVTGTPISLDQAAPPSDTISDTMPAQPNVVALYAFVDAFTKASGAAGAAGGSSAGGSSAGGGSGLASALLLTAFARSFSSTVQSEHSAPFEFRIQELVYERDTARRERDEALEQNEALMKQKQQAVEKMLLAVLRMEAAVEQKQAAVQQSEVDMRQKDIEIRKKNVAVEQKEQAEREQSKAEMLRDDEASRSLVHQKEKQQAIQEKLTAVKEMQAALQQRDTSELNNQAALREARESEKTVESIQAQLQAIIDLRVPASSRKSPHTPTLAVSEVRENEEARSGASAST